MVMRRLPAGTTTSYQPTVRSIRDIATPRLSAANTVTCAMPATVRSTQIVKALVDQAHVLGLTSRAFFNGDMQFVQQELEGRS